METAPFSQGNDHYAGRKVTVTGGTSFIGSHLVEDLLRRGARVRVVDNLSTGTLENLDSVQGHYEFLNGDLRSPEIARAAVANADTVFHLAAVHGGRGFIESRSASLIPNFGIDSNVFSSAARAGVGRVVHASSACAYPISLQADSNSRTLLAEGMVDWSHPASVDPDGTYGWTKLIGELQLREVSNSCELTGRSARIFTAFGPRENETHAAVALVAKALLKMDPYPIWGDGNQTRNFTFVDDTVAGLALLGSDYGTNRFDVFNIGTSQHIRVIDFVNEIFETVNWRPREIKFENLGATGVASRASDNSKIRSQFEWEPISDIRNGIEQLVSWYSSWASKARTVEELVERLK